jgi:hypothetical protein
MKGGTMASNGQREGPHSWTIPGVEEQRKSVLLEGLWYLREERRPMCLEQRN